MKEEQDKFPRDGISSPIIGTPANHPVQFMYFQNGFYFYAGFCCDFGDPHTSIFASPTALSLGCSEEPNATELPPPSGVSEPGADPPDPPDGDAARVDPTPIGVGRQSRGLATAPKQLYVVRDGEFGRPPDETSSAFTTRRTKSFNCKLIAHPDADATVQEFIDQLAAKRFRHFKVAHAEVFAGRSIEPISFCFDAFSVEQDPEGRETTVEVRQVEKDGMLPIAWITIPVSYDGVQSWENCLITWHE